jgi:UDP-2-acetamido-3-amino-2,3-dideoxy-glucuronate N-acetyltransferase
MRRGYFVHASSCVDEGARIGKGTKIWHFCHVMTGATVGECCNIGQNVFIAGGVTVGSNVKIQNNVSLYSGVSVVFTNVINPLAQINRRDEYQRTRVSRGVSLGANATIVCGITLGHYAFIGAGSVVTHDIPGYALAYGNPARVRGWMCECGASLDFHMERGLELAVCEVCGKQYGKDGQAVSRSTPA